MTRTEIRITGFGGQGVVLAGYIIGRAVAVHEGRYATMIQSFGPEARGSACSATLAVSETEIFYPYIGKPDIFVVMSSEGYEKFGDHLGRDDILIHEADLVRPPAGKHSRAFGVPSTRIAESLGKTIVQNIVMVGFFAAVTRLVSADAMRDAVRASVPRGTEDLNLRAFEAGYDYFEKEYGGTRREKDQEEPVAAGGECHSRGRAGVSERS